MPVLFANNVVGTLAISVGPIDTILELTPGHGAGFPTIGADDWFYITLVDSVSGENEICRVTERDGDSLTVERGVDSTISRAWEADTIIEMRPNAQVFRDLQSFDTDAFLRRTGGIMTGPIEFLASPEGDATPDYWNIRGLTDGGMLVDSTNPDAPLYLFPNSRNGSGTVIAYRLQYALPVLELTAGRDLASGNGGVASFLLVYNSGSAANLRIISGAGNTAWQQGNFFSLTQRGVGAPTITAGPGVTLLIPSGFAARPRAQNSVVSATALSQTAWLISGDLAEA